MAQTSGFWTTDDSSPAGHQVASYTDVIAAKAWAILASCGGKEGVSPSYLSYLAPSSTGDNNVRIAPGGAVVDGQWYENGASEDFNIPSAVGGGNTRIDRVVLKCTWADFDVVLEVLSGSDAATPVAPSLTQTPGTEYDIQICQVLVNTSGNITITDERTWAIVGTDGSTLEGANVLTESSRVLRVKDGGITAAKIANRARKFLAPAVSGYDNTLGANIAQTTQVGFLMRDSSLCYGFAAFQVPQDFVSGLTVAPVFYPTLGSGNIYYKSDATYGAAGEAYNVHSSLGSYAAVAGASDDWMVGTALSLSSAAADDYVTMRFYRDASHANDTYGDYVYFLGFLVSYTADS